MALTDYVAGLPAHASDSAELVAAKAVLAAWANSGWDCPSGLLDSDPASAVDPDPLVAKNASGCFFFHAFWRAVINGIFADDLAVVGQDVDSISATKTLLLLLVESSSADGAAGASFCNDVDAHGAVTATHSCEEQVDLALVRAYGALTTALGAPSGWIWGRSHTVSPESFSPFATAAYSPGPFARPGGALTVDVGTPGLSGDGFAYRSGSNVRHLSLMDPAAPVIRMQLPGPERDGPVSSDPPNLLAGYVKNAYFDFAFGARIDTVATSVQTFTAK